MKQNKSHSYNKHSLCKGCKLCIKGNKSVIYITGICPRQCFYCPLSDQKKDLDVMFANERPVKNITEILDEVRISKSIGAGITGGDPLSRLKRTTDLIKRFKKDFGKSFHIHLYTSLDLVTKKSLDALHKAGLDEIRFHPDLDDSTKWYKLELANSSKYKWQVGIEIPAIPGYFREMIALIQTTHDWIDFLNINELEISDTNGNKLGELGFICKDEQSYAIKGSNALSLRIMKILNKNYPKLPIHYCTSKLKDGTQMANRLKIRAKSIKKPYDVLTKEGMLMRGFISCTEKQMKKVQEEYDIPDSLIDYDNQRKQTLIAPWVVIDISKDLNFECGLVTEYPTWDRMIVEKEFLNHKN